MLKLIGVAAVVLATALGAAEVIAGAQNFTFHNQSSITVRELYISPSNEATWGEDVLGLDMLPPGESTDIEFSGYGDTCNFDIKVVDTSGGQAVVSGWDLCSLTDVTYN